MEFLWTFTRNRYKLNLSTKLMWFPKGKNGNGKTTTNEAFSEESQTMSGTKCQNSWAAFVLKFSLVRIEENRFYT